MLGVEAIGTWLRMEVLRLDWLLGIGDPVVVIGEPIVVIGALVGGRRRDIGVGGWMGFHMCCLTANLSF